MGKLLSVLGLMVFLLVNHASAESISLNDGTTIKGTVISSDEKNIVIETEFGRLTISKDKVVSIEYKEREGDKVNSGRVEKKVELTRLESRKQGDITGLMLVYGLTIIGDLAVGGDLSLIGNVVPVVGPFIAMTEEGSEGYEALLLLSGVIQSAFFIDYLSTSQKISSLESSNVSIYPMPNNVGLVVSFSY